MTGNPDAKQFYKYGLADHLHLNQFSCNTSNNMKVILGVLFVPFLIKIVWTDESIDFLVRHGGGEDFVYSPIGVN